MYTALETGQVQYHRFVIAEGQNIFVQSYKNTLASDLAFIPSSVLIGPGLIGSGTALSSRAVPRRNGRKSAARDHQASREMVARQARREQSRAAKCWVARHRLDVELRRGKQTRAAFTHAELRRAKL
ncbi:MAG TPA: hypothetical protein VEG65_02995 [Candidatus Bathyarchaeia archaeon]|nr:hypothetical protein [Candidatus Bathyarchaeia archaeon]